MNSGKRLRERWYCFHDVDNVWTQKALVEGSVTCLLRRGGPRSRFGFTHGGVNFLKQVTTATMKITIAATLLATASAFSVSPEQVCAFESFCRSLELFPLAKRIVPIGVKPRDPFCYARWGRANHTHDLFGCL